MKSIKKTLFINFVLIITISVIVLEVLSVFFIRTHFYKSLEVELTTQISTSADIYKRLYSKDRTLEDNVANNVDIWWQNTNAQVQILNTDGDVLMDSLGVIHNQPINQGDFLKAKDGQKGVWIGKVDYNIEKVMAVSYPLVNSGNKIVGVIRLISSLNEVNNQLFNIILVFIIFGVIVIVSVGLISGFIAKSMINPIEDLTFVAEKMARGDFSIRNTKKTNDEIGKLSDTMNFMADEIIKKDEIKNNFISQISHELRTPLTIIKGWAITLKNNDEYEIQIRNEGLDMIVKESDRLKNMVDELLNFSRLISGKEKLEVESANISEVIEFVQKFMIDSAKRRKIDLVSEIEDNIPLINIDVNKIKQVLINIIENSLKFTNVGGTIRIVANYKNNLLIISIIDNGSGISSEELPMVKERFYKGKTSKSKNGIGLSICDEIVKLHGGKLVIESEINKGTKVSMILPYSNLDISSGE